MTKRNTILKSLICFMFGLASFVFIACGAAKPTAIEVIEGLPAFVRQDEQIDLSNLKLKVTYSNDKTKQIGVGEIEYSFSSAELGMQDLVIKYTESKKEVSITVQVQVISKTAIAGVEINAFSGAYDGQNHSVAVTGAESDDVVKYSLNNGSTWLDTAPVFKNAGEYPVQVKVERANYDDLIVDKTISIAKKDLTIAGKTYNVIYGDNAPIYELEYTGFVAGEGSANLLDQPTRTCDYNKTSDVGSYDVVIANAKAENYNISYKNGVVKVAKKQLTVTASSHNLTYGDDVPTYSVDIDAKGFVNGQDKSVLTAQPIVSCSYAKNSDVGSYDVVPSGAEAKNYSFNYVLGSVTVAKRTVDVAWGNLNIEYTGEKIVPTASFNDVNNSLVALNVEANDENGYINVGTGYAVSATLNHKNYQLNNTTASTTFAIVKATNKWLVAPAVADVANNSEVNPTAVAKFGTPKFEYKLADALDDSYTETKPTQIGHYTLKVFVEQTENYSAIEPQTINFKIYDARQVTGFYSSLLSERAKNVDNFVEKNNVLVAGSQNKFDLQILGECGVDTTTEIDTEILVELFDESTNTYKKIENLDEYVTITYIQNYLQFKPAANGKTFKITAKASNPADGLNNLVYEVKVVDGYNVYKADELSVIVNAYNHDSEKTENGWRAFKQERNLADVQANAVVLQNNIVINNENIPSYYFWSQAEVDKFTSDIKALTNQSIVGSLKDGFGLYVYERAINPGDNFEFYGNYFNIDYSNLAKMVLSREASYDGSVSSSNGVKYYSDDNDKNTQITTHTSLFRFAGTTKNSNLLIKDLSVFGNGRRSADTRESGGAMLAKIEGLTSVAENNSYSNCYMGFMYTTSQVPTIEEGLTNKLINTKGYNSYNSLLYMWGVKDLLIEGGEFVGAGGPVMIVDHADPESKEQVGGYPSTINIIGTKLESFVTGNEPWFASYGATALVPQIKAADEYYNKVGATFLQEQTDYTGKTIAGMMNLKVVYKSSAAEGITAAVVKGEVNFYNNREEYQNKSVYGLDLTTYSAAAVASNNNILQNSRTGVILNPSNLDVNFAKVEDTGVTNLNFYLQNGMGIVLQLYKK